MAIGDRIYKLTSSALSDALKGKKADEHQFTEAELQAATEAIDSDTTAQKVVVLEQDWEKYVEELQKTCENRILETENPEVFKFSSNTENGFTNTIDGIQFRVFPTGDSKFRLEATLESNQPNVAYSIEFRGTRIIINNDFPHLLLPFTEKSSCGMSMYYFRLKKLTNNEVFANLIKPEQDTQTRDIEYSDGIALVDLQYFQKFNPNGTTQLIIQLHKDKPDVLESKFELTSLVWWNQGEDYSFLVEDKKTHHLIRHSNEKIEIPSGFAFKGFNIRRAP